MTAPTPINRQPLPASRKGGSIDLRATQDFIKQNSGPKTPDEAKALVDRFKTLDFGSPAARDAAQTFLRDVLPKLVTTDPVNAVDRDYKQDLTAKSWNDNVIDGGEMKQVVSGWGAKPIARIQAEQLKRRVAQAMPLMDKKAQKVANEFIEKKLPGLIKDPDVDADFAAAAAKGRGTIDDSAAKGLIKGLAKPGMRQAQADDLRAAVTKFTPQMDKAARADFDKLVKKTLASLIAKQDLTTPGKATLSWTPPVSNTDGSPLTDLAGYKVFIGPSSGNYTDVQSVTDPSATSFVVKNLPSGPHFFTMTALDTQGNESVKAGEVHLTEP